MIIKCMNRKTAATVALAAAEAAVAKVRQHLDKTIEGMMTMGVTPDTIHEEINRLEYEIDEYFEVAAVR